MRQLARPKDPPGPPDGTLGSVIDDEIVDVPVRIYEQQEPPTGLVIYSHGGGFTVGSRSLMDNIARGIANASGANVISVEYRLAPENPFPAGLDDVEAVTRWAYANCEQLRVAPTRIVLAGESAGGNLTASMTLRLRGDTSATPAGQILIYPAVADASADFASRRDAPGEDRDQPGGHFGVDGVDGVELRNSDAS